MNRLAERLKTQNISLLDDKESRLPTRPSHSQSSNDRSFPFFQDLGTTLGAKSSSNASKNLGKRNGGSSQTMSRQPLPSRPKRHDSTISDLDDDELDFLSSQASSDLEIIGSSRKPKKSQSIKKKKDTVLVDGKELECHPQYTRKKSSAIAGLKFKKNIPADDGGESRKPPVSELSKIPEAKENGVEDKLPRTYSQSKLSRTDTEIFPHDDSEPNDKWGDWESEYQRSSRYGPLRDKSPNRVPPLSPPHQLKLLDDTGVDPPPQTSRPKPRPLPAKKAPPVPDHLREMVFGSSKDAGNSSTVAATEKNTTSSAGTAVKKLRTKKQPAAAPFGSFSPVASSKTRFKQFPATVKDDGIGDDFSGTKSNPNPFPILSPASSPNHSPSPSAKKKKLIIQDFPSLSPQHSPSKEVVTDFPAPSPLRTSSKSSKFVKSSKLENDATVIKKGKGKKKGVSVSMHDGDTDGADISDTSSVHGAAVQPFPMSTQVLDSIGSPVAGPSRPLNRLSDERNNGKRKKLRESESDVQAIEGEDFYNEEDSMFLSPSIDPSTLCPYCDTCLPPSPSPLLKRLIAATAKKSRRDPRPSNPLGRKAPLATFIAVCQRHRFETQILPEAEAKGWPKSIDWGKLSERIHNMEGALNGLIMDPGNDLELDTEGEIGLPNGAADMNMLGPRARSVFWREVMKQVKLQGSRAAAGVRGQFANFEKTQPGYYGELGSMIIHQTLYNLFPPSSLDPTLISPLSANEFVQRILVPEVAARLIAEDKQLKGDAGMVKAVQILRESSAYGVAMFPDDSGETDISNKSRKKRGENDGDEEEMGVGDLIVMERARKRRKELKEEEEEEEELLRLEEEQRQQTAKIFVKKKGSRERGRNRDDVQTDVSEPDAPLPPPKPKPRPRPIPKGNSKIIASASDSDSTDPRNSGQSGTDDGYGTTAMDMDSEYDVSPTTGHRSRSKSVSELVAQQPQLHPPSGFKSTKKSLTKSKAHLTLGSENDSTGDCAPEFSGGVKGRRIRPRPLKRNRDTDSSGDHDGATRMSSPATPPMRSLEINSDEEDTPKPRITSMATPKSSATMPPRNPLDVARERNNKMKKASMAQSKVSDSYKWLLSSSSMESMA